MHTINKLSTAAVLALSVLTGTGAAALAETLPPPAAETKQATSRWTSEQALAKAREMFPELAHLKYEQADLHNEQFLNIGHPIWSIQLYRKDPANAHRDESESAWIVFHAETGTLLLYQRRVPEWASRNDPGKELAKSAADGFLERYAPDLLDKIALSSIDSGTGLGIRTTGSQEFYWATTSVLYTEQVGGIPFLSNSVRVEADEQGRVIGYVRQFNADSSKLPPAADILTPEQAKEKLTAHLQLNLIHHQHGGKHVLAYLPTYPYAVDGKNGKPSDALHPYLPLSTSAPISLTSTEPYRIANDGDLKRVIAALSGSTPQGMSLIERPPAPHEEGRIYGWVHPQSRGEVRYDPATGRLLSYQSYGSPGEANAGRRLTTQQGQSLARAALAKLLPPGTHELIDFPIFAKEQAPAWYKLAEGEDGQPDRLTYDITRSMQGIPLEGQSFRVELDPYTGAVTSLQGPIWQEDFKNLPGRHMVLPAEGLREQFLNLLTLRPVYVWQTYRMQKGPAAELVYEVIRDEDFLYIDAVNGTFVRRK